MRRMKNRIITYLAVFLLVTSFLEGCATINTMVSLKYETDYPGYRSNCVSKVTGDDLCLAVKRHKAAAIGCLAGFAVICGIATLAKKSGQ
jgi:hypothetical protein